MYAFLSHASACDALRSLGNNASDYPRWPNQPRKLPRYGDCVSTQRAFAAFARKTDLQAYGMGNDPVHLLVPSASSRSRGKSATFHVWSRELPAHSLYRLSDALFASAPELVLLQMAAQKGVDRARLWYLHALAAANNNNFEVADSSVKKAEKLNCTLPFMADLASQINSIKAREERGFLYKLKKTLLPWQ